MPEYTVARLELKTSNSFSGFIDETVVDIWIRTVDYRKGVVGMRRHYWLQVTK